MSDPMKYDDLDYRPSYGTVTVRGQSSEWGVEVDVAQGRAMEKDGFKVIWVYSSAPGWVADMGLTGAWIAAARFLSWPSRVFR